MGSNFIDDRQYRFCDRPVPRRSRADGAARAVYTSAEYGLRQVEFPRPRCPDSLAAGRESLDSLRPPPPTSALVLAGTEVTGECSDRSAREIRRGSPICIATAMPIPLPFFSFHLADYIDSSK